MDVNVLPSINKGSFLSFFFPFRLNILTLFSNEPKLKTGNSNFISIIKNISLPRSKSRNKILHVASLTNAKVNSSISTVKLF